MIFNIIAEKDESDYYVGEVPALPGCFSQGKTIEELKGNITEAIEGWLEVMNDKAKKGNAQIFEVTVWLLQLSFVQGLKHQFLCKENLA